MIVTATTGGRLRLIAQPDHAHLAAEILRLWRADGLPEHPRREDLLFAVREHDNGWREADSAPRVDAASGRPLEFLHIDDDLRREIWERAVDRHLEARPYPAAIIAEHARSLLAAQRGEAWDEFHARILKMQESALALSGQTREAVVADYPWLRLADDLSLWICGGARELDRPGRTGRRHADAWEVEPFPFAGAITFRIACRHVPAGPYPGDAALATAAAAARWEDLEVRLRRRSADAAAW